MTDQDTLAFFKDPDASSFISLKQNQIAAPTVRGKDISIEEMSMGGGVRIVMYFFDRSPSMKSVEKLFIKGVNEDMVPAIKEAREDDISVLRMGALSFSTDITPIWKNSDDEFFHPLEDLPELKKSEFDCEQGCGTSLHASIIEGYARAVKYANLVKAESGIQPEIDILVLTDGYNNERPQNPAEVAQVINGSKKELVRFTFLYFETGWGQMIRQKLPLRWVSTVKML